MIYYFYATEHPLYLAAMRTLKVDLVALGLPYTYDTFEHLSRFENVLLRPVCISKVLRRHMCPVVSLDVDCRVLSKPMFESCDIACRMYNGNVPILGTLYLEPTKPTFNFLHDWYHAMISDGRNQQIPFRKIFKSTDLKKGVLPDEYAVLKEEGEEFDHPVIIHDYISRRL